MNKAIVSLLAHVLLAVIGGMLRRHVSLLVAIAALFIASGHVYDWWAAGRAVTVVSPKAGTFPMEKGRLVQIEKSAEHGAATGGVFLPRQTAVRFRHLLIITRRENALPRS